MRNLPSLFPFAGFADCYHTARYEKPVQRSVGMPQKLSEIPANSVVGMECSVCNFTARGGSVSQRYSSCVLCSAV